MPDINKLVFEEIVQLKLNKGSKGENKKEFIAPKEESKDKTPLPKEEKEFKETKPEGKMKDINPKSGEKASNLLQKKLQHVLNGL